MIFSRVVPAALVLALCVAPVSSASSASVDQSFRNAVGRMLNSIRGVDFLDELSPSEKREFVACAQRVMDDAPTARKQYVLAAKNQSEMRQRFDEVALDNRAKLKQRITLECA
jgi:hypothetical protein